MLRGLNALRVQVLVGRMAAALCVEAYALRDGETSEALDRQAEAIDSLRDGIRGMAEDMRQAEGQGE